MEINNDKFEGIDLEKVPEGYYFENGLMYDKEGKYCGVVPRKEYESKNKYLESARSLELSIKRELYPKPNPITWSDFDKRKFPKQKWRIKNLIPKAGIITIASPSGEKKTYLAMEMARCIANNENFLNRDEFKTDVANVLYIDQEMPEELLQERGRQLNLNNTLNNIYLLKEDSFDLSCEENIDWLFDFIEEKNIEVVIIDTLRAVAGGLNEDKAEEVRMFFERFNIVKKKRIALIIIDHLRKIDRWEGGTPDKNQLFGSQDKLASVDVLIMIRSKEREEEIKVYQKKNRYGIEYEPFLILMKNTLGEDNTLEDTKISFEYGGALDEKEYKKDEAKEYILDLLSSGGKTRKQIIDIIYHEKKIGEKNTSQALRELDKSGLIISEKQGRENFYTLPDNKTNNNSLDNLFDSN